MFILTHLAFLALILIFPEICIMVVLVLVSKRTLRKQDLRLRLLCLELDTILVLILIGN